MWSRTSNFFAILVLGLSACAGQEARAGMQANGAADGGLRPKQQASSGGQADEAPQSEASDAEDSDASAELTDSLSKDLQFLREEEKLARDVYLTLFKAWELKPHQNIASSEQMHMDRVSTTLAALAIQDPVVDDAVGAFVNPTLAKLFADLSAQGRESELSALRVGATIEDLDIRDLEVMQARTNHPLALATYANLACGSRNHLRTFVGQLEARGETYEPTYMSPAEYERILTSARERCGR